MVGIALGEIGMTLADFDSLLPEEFSEVVRNARKVRRDREISALAMVRLHATICVQPHVSKSLRPSDLFAIPELDNPAERAGEGSRETTPKLSREEQRARWERLLEQRRQTAEQKTEQTTEQDGN